MYSNIKRSAEYKRRLLEFVQCEYGMELTNITPAKRGYYGETWRLETVSRSYFLKLDYSPHQAIYERSFPVVEYLRNYGAEFISRIAKTKEGELSARFDGAVLGVFDWIDGENVQNEQTKIAEYGILGKVYAVPVSGVPICRETFSSASADLFFSQWNRLKGIPDDSSKRILSIFEKFHERLTRRAERLSIFAGYCKSDTSHFYITHGDAGGNVIANSDDFFLVDWDDPRVAPPERDAWFCLYWDWAMTAFNDVLRANGINYTLRSERLAYYCYHSFFFYLTEYMQTYFDIDDTNGEIASELLKYFDGWIEEEIRYADKML